METRRSSSRVFPDLVKPEDTSPRGVVADLGSLEKITISPKSQPGDHQGAPGQFQSDNGNGYYSLAHEMAKIPERMILRRFGTLNAQNLLYYQAELTQLEAQYRKMEKDNCGLEDKTREQGKNPESGTNMVPTSETEPTSEIEPVRRLKCSRNWWALAEWPDRSVEEKKQWELFQRIRVVMEKYSMYPLATRSCGMDTDGLLDDALIQQMRILRLKDPGNNDLKHLQNFTSNPDLIKRTILGPEGDIWGSDQDRDRQSPDLVALRGRQDYDSFSNKVMNTLMPLFFRLKGPMLIRGTSLQGEVVYDEHRLLRFVSTIVSIVSSQLPIASIVVLHCVKDIYLRFAIISVCALLVTLCLICFTKVSPVEVFLVTAA